MTAAAKGLAVAAALLAAAPAVAAKRALAPGDRVDLNRAPLAELMRLPGVGERRARAIVAHRERQPFRRPEDVILVKGLGRAWFARVKAHLVVGAASGAAAGGGAGAAAGPAAR